MGRTQSSQKQGEQNQLRRALGFFDAAAISLGAIIGAGIFVVTGIAAGLAGPSFIISIVLAGVIASFSALSFAQLSAYMPREGGGYEFAYRLISPYVGFLAGWMWVLSNLFVGAAVSLGFAQYLVAIFPALPMEAAAVAFCLLLTFVNFVGVRESATLNDVLVVCKIAVLLIFVVLGIGFIDMRNYSPIAPKGLLGVLEGAALIFFAYGGYARVTTVAEEVKDPSRNIPGAILLALLLSTILYLAVGSVAVGLIGAQRLSESASPLADAIAVSGHSAALLVAIGAMIATASVLLVTILGVSRMAFAMARNRQLPEFLSRIHKRFQTPYYTIWVTGLLSSILVFVGFSRVVAVGTFALLFHHALVNLAATRLSAENRRFPVFFSILGFVLCLALLVFLSLETLVIAFVALIVGSLYYEFGIRRRKSREAQVAFQKVSRK